MGIFAQNTAVFAQNMAVFDPNTAMFAKMRLYLLKSVFWEQHMALSVLTMAAFASNTTVFS